MTEFNPEQVGQSLMGGLAQAQAMLSHAMEPERFEYALVIWDNVNPMAREGWVLLPMGPVFGFTPAGMGFVMQRKLGAADEAAALLQQPSERLCGPEQPHEKPAGTESAGSGHLE